MMLDAVALLRLRLKQQVQRAEELIGADKTIRTDSVATALGCYHGLACKIMHDGLKFRKVCARWVPRELKGGEKKNRMGLSLQHLLQYADREGMLNRGVTGTKHGCITNNPN
jgi:hypothetical protein